MDRESLENSVFNLKSVWSLQYNILIYLIIFQRMQSTPSLKWAQRKDKVIVTVELEGSNNVEHSVTPTKFTFKAEKDGSIKEFDYDLFAEIVPDDCQKNLKGRYPLFVLSKKDQEAEHWPRLTKEKLKTQFINIDWGRYVDEDDEDEEGD